MSGEEKLAQQLEHAGYYFDREYKFALVHGSGRQWRADFYLNDYKLIVEVDGVTWTGHAGRHQDPRGYEGDCEKLNFATCSGIHVLRFTPRMVDGKAHRGKNKTPIPSAIDTINEFCLGYIPTEEEYKKGGYAKLD